jgi:hypothetical protein
VAAALAARGHEVVAVESSPSLRGLLEERRLKLDDPQSITVVSDDPRTLSRGRRFELVIAPHQALGLAKTPDELHALLSVIARHLEPDGTFALDALNEPSSIEGGRPRLIPHLRDRAEAIHPLDPLRLSAQTLDAALASVGLEARERFSNFSEATFTSEVLMQIVVGGVASPD